MDQIKIGKFIASRRKDAGLTQLQLAEQLGITDRAVSKWETGKALPDAALMLPLCRILAITVNDLLSGEIVPMENYNKEMEKKLLELAEAKQQADRNLLRIETLIGTLCIVLLLGGCVIAAYLPNLKEWTRVILVVAGMLPLLIACPFMIRIEQTAGYYECGNCHHRYVPTFSQVVMAMHINRTRYMKCPKCGKKSWQKKVISLHND